MISFTIPDMTCGHCKSTVETAIRTVDSKAEITIDLTAKTADVETVAPAERIAAAITAAGYTPGPRASR